MSPDVGLDHDLLRRSPSQSSLYLPRISSNVRIQPFTSSPSSAPSSPRPQHGYSSYHSYTSTPSSSVSLDEDCSTEQDEDLASQDDGLGFPDYSNDYGSELNPHNDESLLDESGEVERPRSLPLPFAATAICGTMTVPMYREVHRLSPAIEDDIRLGEEPAGQVDYFGKAWKEEDIWSSWRYVVSRRRTYVLEEGLRFENASWRSWSKSRFSLPEVGQDVVGWYELIHTFSDLHTLLTLLRHGEREMMFLFGPHVVAKQRPLCLKCPPNTTQLSRSTSFTSKKTILKKRSVSEAMLQRSLSACTLMKQATEAVKTQQPIIRFGRGPLYLQRTRSEYTDTSDHTYTDVFSATSGACHVSSASTSGSQTPSSQKKHIHFNNKVEQCIAIRPRYYYGKPKREDSSDDDMLTMKPSGKAKPSKTATPRNSFSEGSKTIAMLPSTTLRGATPEPPEEKERGSFWSTPSKLSSSSSQETIKPTFVSGNFLLDDDEDAHIDWHPSPASASKANTYINRPLMLGANTDPTEETNQSLHRTPSGMFMPNDDEDDDDYGGGIIGKVFDTINTAKDIAHVIWNVGWRR